jgi:hypothetical protein
MKTEGLDERVMRLADHWAQGVSRRGLLARVGEMALGLTGLTVAISLPVHRVFAQSVGFPPCSDWQMCGIHGAFCKACCGEPASFTSCKCGMTKDGSWPACCTNNNVCPTYRRMIYYHDCCAPEEHTASFACQGEECPPGGGFNTPGYCAGNRTFRCTIIADMGPC